MKKHLFIKIMATLGALALLGFGQQAFGQQAVPSINSVNCTQLTLTSTTNVSLHLTVTPMSFSGGAWLYQINWQRVRQVNGSVYVNGHVVSNPASPTGSVQVLLSPAVSSVVTFDQNINGGGVVLLRKHFMTLVATTNTGTAACNGGSGPTPTPGQCEYASPPAGCSWQGGSSYPACGAQLVCPNITPIPTPTSTSMAPGTFTINGQTGTASSPVQFVSSAPLQPWTLAYISTYNSAPVSYCVIKDGINLGCTPFSATGATNGGWSLAGDWDGPAQNVTSAGVTLTNAYPPQTDGSWEAWLQLSVNGQTLTTNHIYFFVKTAALRTSFLNIQGMTWVGAPVVENFIPSSAFMAYGFMQPGTTAVAYGIGFTPTGNTVTLSPLALNTMPAGTLSSLTSLSNLSSPDGVSLPFTVPSSLIPGANYWVTVTNSQGQSVSTVQARIFIAPNANPGAAGSTVIGDPNSTPTDFCTSLTNSFKLSGATVTSCGTATNYSSEAASTNGSVNGFATCGNVQMSGGGCYLYCGKSGTYPSTDVFSVSSNLGVMNVAAGYCTGAVK